MRFPVIDYRIVVVDVVVVVTDTSSVGIWYDGGWSSRFCCDNINTSDDERNITMGVQLCVRYQIAVLYDVHIQVF